MALTKVPNSMQQTPFRKNLIINGGMTISQRAALFPSVTSADYTLDRWQIGLVGAMALQVSQETNDTAPELTSSYLFLEVTTADASVGSTDFTIIQQPIEGYNVIPLGWQLADQSKKNDVTVSFWHSYTKTGTQCVALRNAGNTRSYIHEFTQAVADTWEYTSFTVPAPTDGTWVVENTTSLKLVFIAMAGTAFQTTADAWQAGNYFATSNQVNNMDSTSNKMRITGVQLEVGTEATDFEYRPFSEELSLCLRYYEKSFEQGIDPAEGVTNGSLPLGAALNSSVIFVATVDYKVEKRVLPSITFYRSFNGAINGRWSYFDSTWNDPSTNPAPFDSNTRGFGAQSGTASTTQGFGILMEGHWTADAEL